MKEGRRERGRNEKRKRRDQNTKAKHVGVPARKIQQERETDRQTNREEGP